MKKILIAWCLALNAATSCLAETATNEIRACLSASIGQAKKSNAEELPRDCRVKATDADATALAVALDEHVRRFGFHPAGGNAAVVKALRGGNPGQTALMRFPHLSHDGRMLDPWRTPYDIAMTNGSLRVRSAGSNGTLGDEDDIVEIRPIATSVESSEPKRK
ncbi:MAG: hypothetical protein ACOX9C_03370 [Kiritimatiellia bacterium]|jgi:hypothetical protein